MPGWFGNTLDEPPVVTGWWAEIAATPSPSGAALALLGHAPTVRVSLSAVPAAATLTVSGGTPSVVVTQNQTVTPAAAILTLTGSHPALGVTLRPTGAAVTVTGGTPAVRVSDNKNVQPAGADLTIAGGSPSVSVSDNQRVTPTGATLSVAGSAPAIVTPQTFTPAAANLTLTGSAPAVTVVINIAPNPAALTVSGGTPTVSTPILITPTGASLSVTGSHPALDVTLRPTGASVTVSGGTPSVAVSDNKVLTPTGSPLTVTGGTPVVTATNNKIVQPAAASLTVSGGTPSVATPRVVQPTAAALTVSGGSPTITTSTSSVFPYTFPFPLQAPTGAHYTDNFNRANNASLGANWTAYDVFGLGTTFRIFSNTAAVSAAADFVWSEYNSALSTDDHSVSVTVAATKPDQVILYLRSDGHDYIQFIMPDGSPWEITTSSGDTSPYDGLGTTTQRAVTGASQSFSAADVLSAEASGNVYTLKKNGAVIVSWTDSGAAHTSFVNSSHRKVAMFISASSSASQAVDDFAADDI